MTRPTKIASAAVMLLVLAATAGTTGCTSASANALDVTYYYLPG